MIARLTHPRAVLVVAVACFAALAGAVLLGFAAPADVAVRGAALAWESPAVVGVMRVLNRGGDWRVLLPATLLLFVAFPRARQRWWLWLALMIAAPLLETAFKDLIARPRPEASSMGFPSGHATAAAAYFGAVLYLAGDLARASARVALRAAALAAIVGVAIARVVLRAHWPSDVLGGIALGLALASAAALGAALQRPGAGEG